ncbi:TetR/AcrR family transcriptional regulator [Spirillospora sp. NPDC048911]|uniref:TetR/AcrR family transcriptional regulator n=1 Tax=Spirillospora sp. NPDC048911 TaxID=3364527 RepID=UPI0037148E58
MSTTEIPESGARGRTRRAILSAAATVLARDRSATLADIAKAADVGRSTLHRYYPDRDVLIRAVVDDSLTVVQEATQGAALDEGSALEAMRRLVAGMVDAGDQLVFLWGDPRVLEGYPDEDDPGCDPPEGSAGGPPDDPVLRLIERGQAEGVFDPELSPRWIQHVVWALVYTAVEQAGQGLIPRHGVTSTVIRTLERGVLTR